MVSDEVYRTLYFGDTSYKSMAHYLPNQTVVVGGISKEISGTGIR